MPENRNEMRGDQQPKGRAGQQTGGAVLGTSGMARTGTLSSAGDTRLGARGAEGSGQGLGCATLHSWAGAWHALGT